MTSATATRTRKPAATALWAHLIKTDTLTASADSTSQSTPPPLNPVDKTGTSARLLLSDTQAQFQKFSESMQCTFKEFASAKQDIAEMKKLFDDGHDRLERSVIDLANRCQSEIQKSMGKPAQVEQMEAALHRVSLAETIISNVDKRLDALQALIQSQTQTSQVLTTTVEHNLGRFVQKLDAIFDVIQREAEQSRQQYQAQAQVLQALNVQQTAILTALNPLQSLQADVQIVKDLVSVEAEELSHTKDLSKRITTPSSALGKRKRPRMDVTPDTRRDGRLQLGTPTPNPTHTSPLRMPTAAVNTATKTAHSKISLSPFPSAHRRPLADLIAPLSKKNEAPLALQTPTGIIINSASSPASTSHTPGHQHTAVRMSAGRTSVPNTGLLNPHRPSLISRLPTVPSLAPMRSASTLKEQALINGKRFIPIWEDDDDES